MLRTALLFVRSAVRLVYAELSEPVAVCLPKRAHRTLFVDWIVAAAALPASWVIVSLGGARIVEHRRVQRARPRRQHRLPV